MRSGCSSSQRRKRPGGATVLSNTLPRRAFLLAGVSDGRSCPTSTGTAAALPLVRAAIAQSSPSHSRPVGQWSSSSLNTGRTRVSELFFSPISWEYGTCVDSVESFAGHGRLSARRQEPVSRAARRHRPEPTRTAHRRGQGRRSRRAQLRAPLTPPSTVTASPGDGVRANTPQTLGTGSDATRGCGARQSGSLPVQLRPAAVPVRWPKCGETSAEACTVHPRLVAAGDASTMPLPEAPQKEATGQLKCFVLERSHTSATAARKYVTGT
jgi:hypothetical protein